MGLSMWLLCLAAVQLSAGFPGVDLNSDVNIKISERSIKTRLKVATFKIDSFGIDKMNNDILAKAIKQIVWRYDLILIEGIIADQSEESLGKLLNLVYSHKTPFVMTKSAPLGRDLEKRNYAYFYRTDRLNLLDTYQYKDPDDIFARPPYIALFKPLRPDDVEFAAIGIQTDPAEVIKEISFLNNLALEVERFWKVPNIMIMGEMNTDCSRATQEALEGLKIYQPPYQWLVGKDIDTTVSSTNCAFDRIVIKGERLVDYVIDDNDEDGDVVNNVFRFDSYFGLTEDEALELSDSFPVEAMFEF